ncbi:MAG: enoyl-CoA hydratase/isomerase family protein, partial [Desulfobacterales bacterium]
MKNKPITTDKKDMIGVITLNRPEAMNTFNVPFAQSLNNALRDMDNDEDVRVVVIRAA